MKREVITLRVVHLTPEAISALREGKTIWIDLGDFICVMEKYDISKEIEEELFAEPQIVFEPYRELLERSKVLEGGQTNGLGI